MGKIQPLQVLSTKEAPLNPASAFILSGTHKTLTRKMAEITEEQFQALNDQADAEAALKAKLEEENVALGEEIAALEADLAILKAASADADGTKAALAKKKADLEAKIADLEKEFDVEKKMLKHDLEVTRERLQKEIAGLQKELNKESNKAELKQQQAFIAKLEAEKAEIANIVNKTRDELTAAKEPPTLSRDKPSTLHEPGPDLVTCKEEFETGGGTIFSVIVGPRRLDCGRGIQE